MYKDFTNSAESMRRERYRTFDVARGRSSNGLRVTIGHALVSLGNRLLDHRIAPAQVEGASI